MSICGIDQIGKRVIAEVNATTVAVVSSEELSYDVVDLNLAGNITTFNLSGHADGEQVTIRIRQDSTGSRLVGWGAMFRFTTGLASPTLTTTALYVDRLVFEYNATDEKYDIMAISLGYANS